MKGIGIVILIAGLATAGCRRAFENVVVEAFTGTQSWPGKIGVLAVAFAAVVLLKWVMEGSREPDLGKSDEPGEDEDADQDQRP